MRLSEHDVYVSTVGGVKLTEPAADLAIALALASAMQDKPIAHNLVAYGEISVYEVRGNYQLIVRAVIEDGVGRLQREFEELKKRLADEGLFAPAKKRPIPALPETVGIITSPTGAALQDFLRILVRRDWRGRIVVLPAKVQGEGAAAEMVEMLRLAQELGIFDLLVIGRPITAAADVGQAALGGKSPKAKAAELVSGTKLDDPKVREALVKGGYVRIGIDH